MAKIEVAARELYFDTSDHNLYELRPDGTYQQVGTGGADHTYVKNSDVLPPESITAQFTFSGTAAALGQTTDISGYGLPVKSLVVTKSAGANTGTLTITVSGNGRVLINITSLNAETIAITGLLADGTATTGLCVRKTDGTFVAATALAVGTYVLVTN